jgi:hypothetical protein
MMPNANKLIIETEALDIENRRLQSLVKSLEALVDEKQKAIREVEVARTRQDQLAK